MRIKRITVKKFKNLVDFDCEFSDSNISAFIGNNGAGKSNILELITEAFSVAKNVAAEKTLGITVYPDIFGCNIKYENDGTAYTLFLDKSDVWIYSGEKKLTKKDMLNVLPETIMLYYAGETDRQKNAAKTTFDNRYDNALKKADNSSFPGFKYLDYYSVDDLNLLLVVAAIYKGAYYNKLLDYLGCKNISTEASLFLMSPNSKKGDGSTYWNARGFVKSFLDELRKYVSRTQDLGLIYIMSFDDFTKWGKSSENEAALFYKLKALKNAGYLHMLNVTLIRNDGDKFTHDNLSEGEKQLALIYLLTSFTAKNDCLYLFDEFDSYLHLNWQRSVSKMLNDIDVNGHIIFTTHSPASISKMQRENVYLLKSGKVHNAISETFNRSLDEIMEEQMEVPLRPQEYTELVQEFRNAIIHNQKNIALAKLDQIKEVIGEDDPFFITARIAMERMY